MCNKSLHNIESQNVICSSDSECGGSGSFKSPHASMPARGPYPPTVEDCNTVIKQLLDKNSQQSHELLQIKADLRDVLYSHKWTPDAFLMARAYVSEASNTQQQ